jgi:eukaryotic-like serine/threonine-protein kinase
MQIGQVISGKYRLVRLLGDGGMGSVYEAHHEKLGTRVAIKFLHAELARRTGLADRFLQEARVAAQIKSPHVVHVTDIDTMEGGVQDGGQAYIVMDLLEGEPLSTVLEREHKLSVGVSCEYARQTLEALEAAHALGVIHRDLKPENVFVTFVAGKPVLKLIDFGIAKLRRPELAQKNLTVAGVLMGTAEYMAPEQAFSADKVDARSDVYSVGVMLYEMIAGQRPVDGEDARLIAIKVERGEVKPLVHAAPDVPRELAGLVHRAMAGRPDLRFQSATEMRLALEQALVGKHPPTAPLPAIPGAAALQQQSAGTGTVMGAPADALLAQRAAPPPHAAPHAPYPPQVRPSPQAAMAGGTARVAAVQNAFVPPANYAANYAEHAQPPRRARGNGWLLALAFVIGIGAIGAIVVSQYDVLSGGGAAPARPAVVTPPATTATPASTAPSGASAAPAPAPLAPLVTPPVRPPAPTTPPTPRPHPSAPPTAPPSDAAAPVPPLPSFPIPVPPIPLPSTPIIIPTALPSSLPSSFPFPTFPIPGFGPPVAPPAPSSAPSSGY